MGILIFMGLCTLGIAGLFLLACLVFAIAEKLKAHSKFKKRADIKMKAKTIKKLYVVAPSRWQFKLEDGMFVYLHFHTDDYCTYDIGLSFIDHLRMLRFFKGLRKKEKTLANLEKTEKVIATVKRDIAKEEEKAKQCVEEARVTLKDVFAKYPSNFYFPQIQEEREN